jgi:hypothetical protein
VVADESEDGEWTPWTTAADEAGAPEGPHVAAGAARQAVLVYGRSNGDSSSVHAFERTGRGRWSAIGRADAPLSFEPRAYEPRASVGATGEAAVVWNQWNESTYGVMLARRRAPGEPWTLPASPAAALSAPILYANAPQVAQSAGGDLLVAWYQSTGGPLMVYASERRGLDGQPTIPEPDAALSAPGAPVDSHPVANPRPAFGSDGAAAVVWTQENGRGGVPVYLALRDVAGEWARPDGLGDALSDEGATARCPQAAFRSDGGLVVIWLEVRDGPHEIFGALVPPGARAPASIERLSSAGALAYAPTLAASADQIVAAWIEERDAASVVAVRRLTSEWSPPETLGTAAAAPAVAAGGGRVLLAWPEGPTLGARIHMAALEPPE